MAVKTDEILSSDGIVVSPTKELMTGGHAWNIDRVYQKDTLVTLNDPSFSGELAYRRFFSLTSNNIGNTPLTDTVNWVEDNVVKYISHNVTITVGATGDFARLDDALRFLSKFVTIDGAEIHVKILTGHEIGYEIVLSNLALPNGVWIKGESNVTIRVSGSKLNFISIDGGSKFSFRNTNFTIKGTNTTTSTTPSIIFGDAITLEDCHFSVDHLSYPSTPNGPYLIRSVNSCRDIKVDIGTFKGIAVFKMSKAVSACMVFGTASNLGAIVEADYGGCILIDALDADSAINCDYGIVAYNGGTTYARHCLFNQTTQAHYRVLYGSIMSVRDAESVADYSPATAINNVLKEGLFLVN